MAKAKTKKIWWCVVPSCRWVGTKLKVVKLPGGDVCNTCPKCESEDVFVDEELWCKFCETGCCGPNQKEEAEWYSVGDDCPECEGWRENKLVPKPPRKLPRTATRRRK